MTCCILSSCTPISLRSEQNIIWNNISKRNEKSAINHFINKYPLSPFFEEACQKIINLEKDNADIGGCYINAIGCHIISQDSISIQGITYHYQSIDSTIYNILSENRYPKSILKNDPTIKYSGSYFVLPIIEDKINLQRWIYKINTGNTLYANQIYNQALCIPNISFQVLKDIDYKLSSKIILTQPYLNRVIAPRPK